MKKTGLIFSILFSFGLCLAGPSTRPSSAGRQALPQRPPSAQRYAERGAMGARGAYALSQAIQAGHQAEGGRLNQAVEGLQRGLGAWGSFRAQNTSEKRMLAGLGQQSAGAAYAGAKGVQAVRGYDPQNMSSPLEGFDPSMMAQAADQRLPEQVGQYGPASRALAGGQAAVDAHRRFHEPEAPDVPRPLSRQASMRALELEIAIRQEELARQLAELEALRNATQHAVQQPQNLTVLDDDYEA